MTPPDTLPSTVVVVDTDVFSDVFVRPARSRSAGLVEALAGKVVVIATQTYAELSVWPRAAGWGGTRTEQLRERIAAVNLIPVPSDVVDAYVDLTVACREVGHALHAKVHTADRWVAATAVALGRPLLSRDNVFVGVPGLQLLET